MAADPSPALGWARRDLGLADNPALRAAISDGVGVLPSSFLNPVLAVARSSCRGVAAKTCGVAKTTLTLGPSQPRFEAHGKEVVRRMNDFGTCEVSAS